MKIKFSTIRALLAVLLPALASGCAHMPSGSVQLSSLPAAQMSSRHVALVLDPALAEYKYEFHRADTWVFPLGTPIGNYAQQAVKQCFRQVDVVPTIEQAASQTSADLILIPRIVRCEASFPVMLTKETRMTLVIEWTGKERATQNTVWLKTITANAAYPMGAFAEGKHQHILMQRLLDDLSLKTYNAFQEAQELK